MTSRTGMGNFSTSDFATLLDEVMAADEPREDTVRPSIVLDLLNPSLSGGQINAADAADYLFTETVQRIEPDRRKPFSPTLPRVTRSVDPSHIAGELGLTGREDAAALDRVRRAFAFINHPDRVEEFDRDVAIVRMQIANRLIDEAKAKRA